MKTARDLKKPLKINQRTKRVKADGGAKRVAAKKRVASKKVLENLSDEVGEKAAKKERVGIQSKEKNRGQEKEESKKVKIKRSREEARESAHEDTFLRHTQKPAERVHFFTQELFACLLREGDFQKKMKTVRVLCRKEKEKLASIYPNLNTRHKHFTQYRKSIQGLVGEMEVRRSKLTAKELESFLAAVFAIMRLSERESDQRGLDFRMNLHQKTHQVAIFDMARFLETCRGLLRDSDPYTVAIGLMGLTGRRTVEILKTGRFETVDKNHLLFSGQAKTKGSVNAQDHYPIPVLAPPREILRAFEYLRWQLDFSGLENALIDQNYSKRLLSRMKVFQGIVTGNQFVKISCRSLRSLYVTSAYEVFKMSTKVAFNAYAAQVLGHSHLDKDTANSYSYFAIKRS